MNVLVIGTGAVGGFYGALLARAGCNVSVMARSDYEQIKQHGISIRSDTELGAWTFHPATTLNSIQKLNSPADVVLLCVKVTEDVDRVSLLKPHIGPTSTIVLLCNGVEIEREIAKAFPEHAIISGLAFVCVTRLAPGQIWHQAFGNLVLGDYPSGISATTQALAHAFRIGGIECEATPHIVQARWQKCVWNAAFNPLSVLAGGLDTLTLIEHAESLIRHVMAEVVEITLALDLTLPPKLIDDQINKTAKAPAYKTSMLLDHEAGRHMEVDAILGNTIQVARERGVGVPHLETLYSLMQMINRK
jgi:2-dehydropantoate 2-reductase